VNANSCLDPSAWVKHTTQSALQHGHMHTHMVGQ